MATIIGSVDQRRRPLIRVQFAGLDDEIMALLDTGFNGAILINSADVAALRVKVRSFSSQAIMADGRKIEVERGECIINWLG